MIKDIERPEVKGVSVAVVKDADTGDWDVFLINLNDFPIHGILITSKGYGLIDDEERKTSTLRWFFEYLEPNGFFKIEAIVEDVFGLHNEYWVSYYNERNVMHDKKYIFLAESIREENFTSVPLVNGRGVMIS